MTDMKPDYQAALDDLSDKRMGSWNWLQKHHDTIRAALEFCLQPKVVITGKSFEKIEDNNMKAWGDMVVYGFGCVKVEHIPHDELDKEAK